MLFFPAHVVFTRFQVMEEQHWRTLTLIRNWAHSLIGCLVRPLLDEKRMVDFPMETLAAPYDRHWLDGVVNSGQDLKDGSRQTGYTIFTDFSNTPASAK